MSDDLQTIGLKQIGRLIHPDEGVRLGEDFFLIDVSEGKNLEFMNYPFRSDAYFLVYCVRGGIDVEVNLTQYSLKKDILLISLPGSIMRVVTSLSKGTAEGRFLVFAISRGFLSDLNVDLKGASEGHMFFASTPCVRLGSEEKLFLKKYLDIVREIMDSDMPGKKGAIGALFSSAFYVLSGLSFKTHEPEANEHMSSSQIRQKTLFENFMAIVAEYHSSERGMYFYADHLGLTPKYLSKLVKQYSGRSAPEWIDSFVILEAKNMLKYTGLSIKEIVYKLHFPNTSVFYRFFKSHTGMTPTEYRNG